MTSLELHTLTPEDNEHAWDRYVDSHPKGTIFHRSALLAAFHAAPKHEVVARAAALPSGKIIALHPAIRVATLQGLVSVAASRSICYAEPLCDDSEAGRVALQQLIEGHDARLKRRTLFAEVRGIHAPQGERDSLEQAGYEFRDYLNYLVDTRKSIEQLWKGLSKSCRKSIRKSESRGVVIEQPPLEQSVERLYPLVVESYCRSKVPLADIDLFHAVVAGLPADQIQIRIATYAGEDVAGGIGLVYRDRFYAWYGGTRRIRGAFPFDLLTWDEICWCAEHGIRWYDFGGAGWPDQPYGPRDFKAKFGGELVRFGRYHKNYSTIRLALANTAYGLMRGILSR